jgi:hypothetical protein|tara:strand:+ start:697 stop:897 length:201 start_codon:yes stop_codon:yes gene_type:complete
LCRQGIPEVLLDRLVMDRQGTLIDHPPDRRLDVLQVHLGQAWALALADRCRAHLALAPGHAKSPRK